MTMTDPATRNGAIAQSTYTPAELSWLLAGRDNPEAERARQILGLTVVAEGDELIRTAVQSLRARNLVSVDENGDVDIEQATKVIGFVLGTGTDWTRLGIEDNGRVEVLVIVSSPEVESALILRLDEFGNYLAAATNPGVHASQITGTMVAGYLTQGPKVAVSVRRDTSARSSALVVQADTSTDAFTVVVRSGIEGTADIVEPATDVVDRATFLAQLETQLADEA